MEDKAKDNDSPFLRDISKQEIVLAALVRQYDRAVAVADDAAVVIEYQAIRDCIREMVMNHFFAAIMDYGVDHFLWIHVEQEGWMAERKNSSELWVSGQFRCNLPGRDMPNWNEPMTGSFRFSLGGKELVEYSVRFGRRTILHDLPLVRSRITAGGLPEPCQPSEVSDWAYVFEKRGSLGEASNECDG